MPPEVGEPWFNRSSHHVKNNKLWTSKTSIFDATLSLPERQKVTIWEWECVGTSLNYISCKMSKMFQKHIHCQFKKKKSFPVLLMFDFKIWFWFWKMLPREPFLIIKPVWSCNATVTNTTANGDGDALVSGMTPLRIWAAAGQQLYSGVWFTGHQQLWLDDFQKSPDGGRLNQVPLAARCLVARRYIKSISGHSLLTF